MWLATHRVNLGANFSTGSIVYDYSRQTVERFGKLFGEMFKDKPFTSTARVERGRDPLRLTLPDPVPQFKALKNDRIVRIRLRVYSPTGSGTL
jgi:hypothetical protein